MDVLRKGDLRQPRGGRPRRHLDPAEIHCLIREGLSLREIARRLHVGYGTVHRIARRLKPDLKLIQNPATAILE